MHNVVSWITYIIEHNSYWCYNNTNYFHWYVEHDLFEPGDVFGYFRYASCGNDTFLCKSTGGKSEEISST